MFRQQQDLLNEIIRLTRAWRRFGGDLSLDSCHQFARHIDTGHIGLCAVVGLTALGIFFGGTPVGVVGFASTSNHCECASGSSCRCACCQTSNSAGGPAGRCGHCRATSGCQKSRTIATWQSDCPCGSNSPSIANGPAPPKLISPHAIILATCAVWLPAPHRVPLPEHISLEPPTPPPERSC